MALVSAAIVACGTAARRRSRGPDLYSWLDRTETPMSADQPRLYTDLAGFATLAVGLALHKLRRPDFAMAPS